MHFKKAQPWAAGGQPAVGAEVETSPTRAADLVADLLVPVGQALVTGALAGGLVVFGFSEVAPGWDVNHVKAFAGVALTVAAVTWGLLLVDTRRLLWGIERVIGLDLDRDGHQGEPQERLVVVNAGKAQEQASERRQTERASQFAQFVAALPARGTAARTWEKNLARDTYQDYRDTLIRLGWAEWNSTKRNGQPNERRGWRLVWDVQDILARLG